MLKRYARLFAYLLLVMLPMQSIAAANMLVCNSLMQSHTGSHVAASSVSAETQDMETMPCHKHAATSSAKDKHQHNCKSSCGALCSSLCAMTALPTGINLTIAPNNSTLISLAEHLYASVSLPNNQRPPIFQS